jgi:molybdopterin-guanine dinucleotide biosynthesis protein B
VHRPALGKPPMYPDDDSILAVVSDVPLRLDRPSLFLDRPQGVADFICQILELEPLPA